MPKFEFLVTVDTDTREHAETVITERVNYDEPYETETYGNAGFDYSVEWQRAPAVTQGG